VCTASWLKRDQTLHFFFNRDELKTREEALPPFARKTGELAWVAPADGRARGTWIAASARGLVLALLNRSAGNPPADAASRGLLIPSLIGATGGESFVRGLAAVDLPRFAPFRMVALWRHLDDGVVAAWDGDRLELEQVDAGAGLLCSSGLGDERAAAARTEVWNRLRAAAPEATPELHRRFHRDHFPEPSAWSVCVHRPEAATVSFSEVELSAERVAMRYRPGPPCELADIHRSELAGTPPPASED
jgi:hypothetical protein